MGNYSMKAPAWKSIETPLKSLNERGRQQGNRLRKALTRKSPEAPLRSLHERGQQHGNHLRKALPWESLDAPLKSLHEKGRQQVNHLRKAPAWKSLETPLKSYHRGKQQGNQDHTGLKKRPLYFTGWIAGQVPGGRLPAAESEDPAWPDSPCRRRCRPCYMGRQQGRGSGTSARNKGPRRECQAVSWSILCVSQDLLGQS